MLKSIAREGKPARPTENVTVTNCVLSFSSTGLAATATAAIVLDQSADGTIVNARGAAGCRRLVHVQGDATRDISVKDSRVPAGASVATFENERVRRAVQVS